MKNLMTRKHFFGLLMAFVLAFGVTGIADAFPLTRISPQVQSKSQGEKFEITFSAGLKGSTRAYNNATPRRLVNSGVTAPPAPATIAEGTNTIDAQGFIVTYINNISYRTTAVVGVAADFVFPAGFSASSESSRFATTAGGVAYPAAQTPIAVGAGTALFVDTARNAVDAMGRPVWVQSGTGARRGVGADGILNTADDVPQDPFTYIRRQADPNPAVSDSDQYDYNDETITVTATAIPAGAAAFNIIDENDGHVVVAVAAAGDDGTMNENNISGKLRNRVTLSCRLATEGTYTITITDTSDAEDRSTNDNSVFPAITFTLYVTEEDLGTPTHVVESIGTSTGTTRVDAGDTPVNVSGRVAVYAVYAGARGAAVVGDFSIRYRVTEGSGTLYVGTRDREDTTPTTDLTVHQAVNVFLKMNGTANEISAALAGADSRTFPATIAFDYIGSNPRSSGGQQQQNQQQRQQQQPRLSLIPSTLSGAPGASAALTAIVSPPAANIPVTFSISGIPLSSVQTNAAGQALTSILLPASNAAVTASAPGYGTTAARISVTGGTPPTTPTTPTVGDPTEITIYGGDNQDGELNQLLDEDLEVQVVDNNNNGVSFEVVRFRVVEGRGRLSPTSARTDRDGIAAVSFTPRSPGSQGTVEVEAYTGDLSPVTFTVNVGEPPDAIKKISGDNQSGRPGAELANPFVVEVVDENGDPVSGTTVAFAVTAGGGSVSPTSATTNASGRAQTTLTLGDAIGDNTVTARVTGIPAVTFRAGAGATVVLDAARRPPIYWVDKQSGTLHRLVDDEVENLASNVENVTSIAVDTENGLLYWGVKVGRSGGKIQRSRLNGRNIQILKDRLTSVPMGIALDASGSTIYWSSASGKIRSMATEGSTKVTKILEDLADPMSLAVSNGYLYWIEPLGRVRRVSLTANRKVAVNIATGLGEPLSIAIAKGKIYWVERSNGGGGALQRANHQRHQH